jgi:hypothetical protein
MREEFRTKPDYTGRKPGIDRDNRAVEGNACERRQACSLSGFEEEGVTFWLSARARVPAGGQSPLWVGHSRPNLAVGVTSGCPPINNSRRFSARQCLKCADGGVPSVAMIFSVRTISAKKRAAAGPAFGKNALYPSASVTGRQALALRSRRLSVTIFQTVMALSSQKHGPRGRAVSVNYVSVLLVWSDGSSAFLVSLPGAWLCWPGFWPAPCC